MLPLLLRQRLFLLLLLMLLLLFRLLLLMFLLLLPLLLLLQLLLLLMLLLLLLPLLHWWRQRSLVFCRWLYASDYDVVSTAALPQYVWRPCWRCDVSTDVLWVRGAAGR